MTSTTGQTLYALLKFSKGLNPSTIIASRTLRGLVEKLRHLESITFHCQAINWVAHYSIITYILIMPPHFLRDVWRAATKIGISIYTLQYLRRIKKMIS